MQPLLGAEGGWGCGCQRKHGFVTPNPSTGSNATYLDSSPPSPVFGSLVHRTVGGSLQDELTPARQLQCAATPIPESSPHPIAGKPAIHILL